jgi:hypothetical protein
VKETVKSKTVKNLSKSINVIAEKMRDFKRKINPPLANK